MSESNGNGTHPILSLEAARSKGTRKGNDFITVQQAHDMVIQECAKVHEYYLTQIPTFVARMIQDALMSYGLIVVQPGTTDITPVVASESPETPGDNSAPSDSMAPATKDIVMQATSDTMVRTDENGAVTVTENFTVPPSDPAA